VYPLFLSPIPILTLALDNVYSNLHLHSIHTQAFEPRRNSEMQVPRSQKELKKFKPLSHGNKSECKKKSQTSALGKAKKRSQNTNAAVGVAGTETVHHPVFSPLIESLPDPPFRPEFKDSLHRTIAAIGRAVGSLFPDQNSTTQRISRRGGM
jgi:hypothetical protein